MKVTLRFNDNRILSELYFDGIYCNNPRLQNYMLNKPFEKWIEPFHTRYVVWQGFLVELREIFNTDSFLFSFFGMPEDFEQFRNLTKQVAPANFNINFEFAEVVMEKSVFNIAFIDKIVSMLRRQNSTLVNQLVNQLGNIRNSVSEINCNVIYGNDYVFRSFIRWVNLPIQVNSLAISMPLILIFDEDFQDNPYEICRLHQIEPSDIIIIVMRGQQDIGLQVLQLKQLYKDIPVFSLTGIDGSELVPISRLYNSYKKKAFRKFILDCPDEVWTEPRAVKNLIATL